MDVTNVPTMDWGQAAATAIRMATRITQRLHVLVPETMSVERLQIIRNYCRPFIKIEQVCADIATGLMDIKDLTAKITDDTACVYFENPSYLGFLETQGAEIAGLIHGKGGLLVVGVDPISLGIIAPPSEYGADIICGDLQPLGVHMNYGGGQSGFISTRDEEKFVMEYPSRVFGIAPTSKEGEYGFGDVAYDRTSFGELRDKAKEYVGTQSALWGITAGVYLSLLGPQGMEEIGSTIIQKNAYAKAKIAGVKNIKIAPLSKYNFKEFVVDFNNTGLTVAQINKALYDRGIFGGKDLSKEFPAFGQTALYCVTEVHTKEDIDRLVSELAEITEGGGVK
ncbi:MAG: aminomethyl-transferring glycine dehydrogenase, partial [Defluviitaleaceae bacterium]|nr:aminomethyl-transferring glycine dehydrogenase [Defluviitaleaceae bacterium]